MFVRESRFGRLVGHFFAGFLDNDLLTSSEAGMSSALSQVIGLVAVPGLFFCLFATFKYSSGYYGAREVLTWPDKVLFVSSAMILTGLLAVVEWDALFPDRRDCQILVPLPLTTRLLFLAKLSSVLLLLVIFWAAANLGPALLFPSVVLTAANSSGELARYCAAHAIATFAASAFLFLFFIGLQGILLNVLSPKWFRRASVYVQLAAVLVLVLSLLLLPRLLSSAVAWIRTNNPWMYLLPPFWFLGVYQVLIGRGGPVFSPLAAAGVRALAAAAAVSALAYLLSYQRHVRKSLESIEAGRSCPGCLARAAEAALNRFALRHPLERACFHFIRATLLRSRLHRLLLAAYVGVGFALVLGGAAVILQHAARGRPTPALLSVQLVLSFFVLSGMRFAFTVPAELPANWTFQAAEPSEKERCSSGVRKAMLAFAVCPVLLALLPFHAFFWGWRLAAAHLVYGGVLSVLLAELLLLHFEKIPFTCTYLPGKANVKALWPLYLAAYWTYAYAMANLEYRLLGQPARFAAFLLAGVAVTAALRRYRKRQFGPGFRFLFEDLPEPAVRTLDISR